MRKLVVVVALLCGCAASCAKPVAGPGQEITEGEAVLVALEHVAAMKWGERSTTLIEGKAAIAYDGEEPLSESTRGFLDQAIAGRGWRWSTEDWTCPVFTDG